MCDDWMMRAGFDGSLWKLAWWSLNVLSQNMRLTAKLTRWIQHITRLTEQSAQELWIFSWQLWHLVWHFRFMFISYVVLLLATVGADGLIRRRKDMMLQRVRFGVFLSAPLSVCLIQLLQLFLVSLRLSALSHCCWSVPLLLYHSPSSGEWTAPMRLDEKPLFSEAARAPTTTTATTTTKTCLRVTEGVRARLCESVCKRVNECALVWQSDSSSRSRSSSSLLF